MSVAGPCFARVLRVDGQDIFALRAALKGHRGVELLDPYVEVTVHAKPEHRCKPGDWIGFQCPTCGQQHVKIEQSCQMWKISQGLVREQWACVHLFAGSFDGWSRAFAFLNDNQIFESQRALTIDCDCDVTQVWQAQGCTMIQDEDEFDAAFTSPWCGFAGRISDHRWISWLRGDEELWLSMSPPCQSWSLGGTTSGLHSSNGLAFLESICVIKKTRPVIVTCECSDVIIKHPHFPIIRQAMWEVGYKLVWSDVTDTADFVKMKRRRWLAVFARQDAETITLGSFKIANLAKPSWNDSSFQFLVPPVVRNQLLLSSSLTEFYGCPDLLPPSMKRQGVTNAILCCRLASCIVMLSCRPYVPATPSNIY